MEPPEGHHYEWVADPNWKLAVTLSQLGNLLKDRSGL